MLHHPFSPENRLVLCFAEESKQYCWLPKALTENAEHIRQVIPYVTLSDGNRFFVYRRKGSEQRLSDKLSIGIGGHIEASDSTAAKELEQDHVAGVILFAAFREFIEECCSLGSGVTPRNPYTVPAFMFNGEPYMICELHKIPGILHYFRSFVNSLTSAQIDFKNFVSVSGSSVVHRNFKLDEFSGLSTVSLSGTPVDQAHIGIIFNLRCSTQYLTSLNFSPEIDPCGYLTASQLKQLKQFHRARDQSISDSPTLAQAVHTRGLRDTRLAVIQELTASASKMDYDALKVFLQGYGIPCANHSGTVEYQLPTNDASDSLGGEHAVEPVVTDQNAEPIDPGFISSCHEPLLIGDFESWTAEAINRL